MDYRNQGDDIGIQNPTLGYNPPPGRGSAFSRPTFSASTSLLSPRAAAGGVGVGVAGIGANRNGHIIANITPILPQPLPTAAGAAAATAATKISHSIDISTSIDDHSSSSQSFGSQIPDPAAPVSNSSQSPAAGAGGILSYSDPPTVTPLTKAFTTANAAAADVSCRYRECLRNHAASVGGHVVDGCGEFMPNGDPSMPEYLKCAACGCHRSFHRKEHEVGESNGAVGISKSYHRGPARLPLLLPPPHPQSPHAPKHFHFGGSGGGVFPPSPSSRPAAPAGSSVVMAFGSNTSGSGGTTTESSSEERLHHTWAFPTLASAGSRKRFRTKFTPEQKEKMLAFAEQIGWRFQKKDEAAVEQFCAEAGVRRQVLKVWMHNNKHTNKKHEQKPLEHDELLPQHHQQQ